MILRLAYLWCRLPEVRRFLRAARRCRQVQHDVLLKKLRRNADSDFGREHGFAEIRSVADFRRNVPLTTYDYYKPYIDRLKRGELHAMFGPGTKLLMFALTSGTTAEAKFIPITQDYFREYHAGWNLWGLRNYGDHLDLLTKKTLGLGSNWRQFCTEGGTPCGNITGLVTQTAPWFARPIFIIPWTLCLIEDPLAKQYAALRLAIASRRVGMLMTANPSTLIGLARLADERRESLVRDIFDGALSKDVDLPGEVRQALHRRVARPRRRRARELERIIENSGHLYPRDFWPGLSVLAIWLGGSVGAYLPRLKEYYGEPALRDHGLSASEGRMTIPIEDGTSAGILEFVHHFFEFIPEGEREGARPTVLEAHELEVGRNYFIVLTTSGGLYRYDIHDLVRCVGFHGTAPVLEFLNKGSSFSSITGEKLSEYQAASAVRAAFSELGLPIETFTLAPAFGDPPGYVLLIERGHCGSDPDILARCVDRQLARWNCEYANRRETGRLAAAAIREIPPGAWNAFRQKRISRIGGSLEQYKHPCLVNDLGFIERLLSPRFEGQRSPADLGTGPE
jgi:hypothetical protein